MKTVATITLEEAIEAWEAFEIPGERSHPCLFCSEAELSEIVRLSKTAGSRQEKECEVVLESAEWLVEQNLAISRGSWAGGARWGCVKCATRDMQILRAQPESGLCLRCGKVNDDTEFRSWWAVEMHSRRLNQVNILTWAYVFSGESVFAEKAMSVMMEYAYWLPDCPVLETREYNRTGLRFSVDPQLDIRFAIAMAEYYDLLYDYHGWDPESRTVFEENVLRSTVKLNAERWPQFMSNGHNMYLTGTVMLAAVGFCLGDKTYISDAVGPESGFLRHLKEDVHDHGFWCESTLNYHMAMVRDFTMMSELLFHAGYDLYCVDRFRKMFLAPLELMVSEQAVIPGWGDGPNYSFGPSMSGHLELLSSYELFFERTEEMTVGACLKRSCEEGRMSCGPLFLSEPWLEYDFGEIAHAPGAYNDHGMGVLRGGQLYARLNYLRDIGGHRHHENLELTTHAGSGFTGVNLTTADYSHPVRPYYTSAVGHNTVSLPLKEYNAKTGGEPASFSAFDQVQILSARAPGTYLGYEQQRTVLLVRNLYLVDFFRISGKEPTEMDWVWHCAGDLKCPEVGQPGKVCGGSGYEWLESASWTEERNDWQATWVQGQPDSGMRPAELAHPFDEEILWQASCDDFLIRRKMDGRLAKIWRANTPYPMGLVSPVFASIWSPNAETPMDDEEVSYPIESLDDQVYFRINMGGSDPTRVAYAEGPGYGWRPFEPRCPVLIARRFASETTFMSALDAYDSDPLVLSVESLFDNRSGAALKVRTADSEEVFVANYGTGPLSEDDVYLDGKFGMTSSSDVPWGMVVDGSEIQTEGMSFSASSHGTQIIPG